MGFGPIQFLMDMSDPGDSKNKHQQLAAGRPSTFQDLVLTWPMKRLVRKMGEFGQLRLLGGWVPTGPKHVVVVVVDDVVVVVVVVNSNTIAQKSSRFVIYHIPTVLTSQSQRWRKRAHLLLSQFQPVMYSKQTCPLKGDINMANPVIDLHDFSRSRRGVFTTVFGPLTWGRSKSLCPRSVGVFLLKVGKNYRFGW